jgi:hypothetical protein
LLTFQSLLCRQGLQYEQSTLKSVSKYIFFAKILLNVTKLHRKSGVGMIGFDQIFLGMQYGGVVRCIIYGHPATGK